MTKFKIARLYFSGGKKQRDISRHINCHYNTVNQIIRLCKEKIKDNPRIADYLNTNKQINLELLNNTFEFLKNNSRKPKKHNRCLDSKNEKIILEKHEKTNGGAKRIFKHLKRAGYDTDVFTIGKIKGVFKRRELKTKRIRTYNGERRQLYNYDEIAAFEFMQYDTKEILDKHALPKEIYEKFKNNEQLPIYQWTLVDAKTKTRFLAWSYARNSLLGFEFLKLVVFWLRSHGISTKINVQFDGGSEFCSMSKIKTKKWNEQFRQYNAHVYDHGGCKWKQNLVERTHRTDDEEFYCPVGEKINTKSIFIIEGQKWIIYYNNRSNDGIGMNGLSPIEKLKTLGIMNAESICRFPCIILDNFYQHLFTTFHIAYHKNILEQISQNVLTNYPLRSSLLRR
ncbi:MAG: Integrase catalytic region [Candidatus Falkowbacteria bacterium GW2011_GWC2_38_22]|uniref:Integrase catalytic region n=1 Tax=Candidatus Falkowbacteria bacterium GW2011_GWE1_38_31 TaxID=1618638 RepID=A0A0G0JVV0_9BACT|nr:MAG: Integrase catalytic region [Candidatus Falkowbacteria bacterium GW2011_GWF2_38_1205]KKQ61961.1 MAG: Integrase catalytic region [Candidatus Falkowbacteria bacterium GW2011_GWC2_38_22]KKQ63877.1 MAG: Integrase catalytic region [Candidatus Falkowbacteria bacterium GW2011_GWF1_38_22]KKQ66134.1 MAG: Integrase catalytic region [Candidatus Falkowbacteria bacterium GW2011_GWE2_38_254]KKQ70737.1 MAG: Integrase catalytic region [Candidatus Falkowbacteria bacterium GW2011_GWE1_38_31]KKQ73107.1 MA